MSRCNFEYNYVSRSMKYNFSQKGKEKKNGTGICFITKCIISDQYVLVFAAKVRFFAGVLSGYV